MANKKYFKCVFIDEEDSFWGRFFQVGEVYLLVNTKDNGELVLEEHDMDCSHQVPAENFVEEIPIAFYEGNPIFFYQLDEFLDWFNARVKFEIDSTVKCFLRAHYIIYNHKPRIYV